jgi:hypothetical protein
MLRPLGKIFGLTFLLLVASVGIVYYQHATSTEKKIEKLEDEKRQLEQIVQRITTEKRVADILVSHQERDAATGKLQTTLLFVEYDRKDQPLPARSFTIEGDTAHIDAMVIKFDRDFVAQNDPLRGHSIALFTKLYGEHQNPADGQPIDPPGKIPDIYRGADPQVSEFELSLWSDFWKLYDDENYRKAKGVRVEGGATGQSVWGPFKSDRLYTITLESAGGLSMTSSPLRGIYSAALRERATASTQPIAN